MRVRTKYGDGTLVGLNTNDKVIGYKVLLDLPFKEDLPPDEQVFVKTTSVEERIYNCLRVEVLSDQGHYVRFGEHISIVR